MSGFPVGRLWPGEWVPKYFFMQKKGSHFGVECGVALVE